MKQKATITDYTIHKDGLGNTNSIDMVISFDEYETLNYFKDFIKNNNLKCGVVEKCTSDSVFGRSVINYYLNLIVTGLVDIDCRRLRRGINEYNDSKITKLIDDCRFYECKECESEKLKIVTFELTKPIKIGTTLTRSSIRLYYCVVCGKLYDLDYCISDEDMKKLNEEFLINW